MSGLKKSLFQLFLLLSTVVVFSQDFSISGTLVDDNGKPVTSCEIIIFTNKSIRGSALTDHNGKFYTALEKGIYTMRCLYGGDIIYQTDFELDKNISLGTIRSFDNTNHLSEIKITAQKKVFETKVDRSVFNVENSVRASGNDAFELLKGTPGVRVQANQISLVGKSTAKVMVDDKILYMSGDDLINYLRSLSSDNIKMIEVITTPPAKYDAEGNSGLINIKLKNAVKDSWLASVRSYYFQTTYPAFSGGLNFSYNRNKLSFTTDIANRKGAEAVWENTDTYFSEETWIGRVKRKDFTNALRGRFSLDYKITTKTSLGGSFIATTNQPDIRDRNIITATNNNNNTLTFINKTFGENQSETLNLIGNLYFIQSIDTLGKKIAVDFDYFRYEDDQNRNFSSQNFDSNNNAISNFYSANNTSNQNIANYSGKVDFEWPTSWAKMSWGTKASFTDNKNNITFYTTSSGNPVLDPNQTNTFDYTENTQSAYINASKTLGEKWETQIGLRFESTQTKGISHNNNQTHRNDYNKLFPTAFLIYKPNDNNSLSLSYNKRIQRPNYNDLNPFKWVLSQYAIVEGNPFLQPSFIHKFEFTHNYKFKLTTNLYYSLTQEGNFQIPLIDAATGITTFYRDNFFKLHNFGIIQTHQFDHFDWWESTNQWNAFYTKAEFIKNVPSREYKGFGASFSSSNTFMFNKSKTFTGEISYSYTLPREYLINKITAYSSLDLGLRYRIPNKGWTFNFYASDIFRGNRGFYTSQMNNIPQTRSGYFDERSFRVGFSYKFGNTKINVQDRESGNNEAIERTN